MATSVEALGSEEKMVPGDNTPEAEMVSVEETGPKSEASGDAIPEPEMVDAEEATILKMVKLSRIPLNFLSSKLKVNSRPLLKFQCMTSS